MADTQHQSYSPAPEAVIRTRLLNEQRRKLNTRSNRVWGASYIGVVYGCTGSLINSIALDECSDWVQLPAPIPKIQPPSSEAEHPAYIRTVGISKFPGATIFGSLA